MITSDLFPRHPSSHRLRKHRSRDTGIYFVTKCLNPRVPALSDKDCHLIVDSLEFSTKRGDVWISAFVIMPEHMHLLCSPRGGSLSEWMHDWISFVAAKTGASLKRWTSKWQDGFYETEIRSARQYWAVLDYIHDNPVRRGLVSRPDRWKFSSIHNQSWLKCLWWG